MIHHGDCLTVLAAMPADSIDACVTDPPYGIGFMGREWDTFKPGSTTVEPGEPIVSDNPNVNGRRRSPAISPSQIDYDYTAAGLRSFQQWTEQWAREVFRVLKPGAHLVVCGAPRSFHRMACGLEDAGFVIRDTLCWLFGQGFPKSMDVSKAIDKAAGVERELLGVSINSRHAHRKGGRGFDHELGGEPLGGISLSAPATDAAKQWQGWHTALKPAWEPIILARKPLAGTVAQNVQQYGTGAIHVDACRIEGVKDVPASPKQVGRSTHTVSLPGGKITDGGFDPQVGRWPANVLLDEDAAARLDEQSGWLHPACTTRNGASSLFGSGTGETGQRVADTLGGGASRFFYVAKPSREERDFGCYGDLRNTHPTVKPVELMRWLVRLITPPNGTVIDPFLGSGTTGMACAYELRPFLGIEREAEYITIATQRIAAVAPLFSGGILNEQA